MENMWASPGDDHSCLRENTFQRDVPAGKAQHWENLSNRCSQKTDMSSNFGLSLSGTYRTLKDPP